MLFTTFNGVCYIRTCLLFSENDNYDTHARTRAHYSLGQEHRRVDSLRFQLCISLVCQIWLHGKSKKSKVGCSHCSRKRQVKQTGRVLQDSRLRLKWSQGMIINLAVRSSQKSCLHKILSPHKKAQEASPLGPFAICFPHPLNSQQIWEGIRSGLNSKRQGYVLAPALFPKVWVVMWAFQCSSAHFTERENWLKNILSSHDHSACTWKVSSGHPEKDNISPQGCDGSMFLSLPTPRPEAGTVGLSSKISVSPFLKEIQPQVQGSCMYPQLSLK